MNYEEATNAVWNSDDPIVKALVINGYGIGLYSECNRQDIYLRCQFMDAYLAAITLAERIAAGDIEIIEKGDSAMRKEYFDRLLQSCAQLDIKAEKQKMDNW